MYRHPPSSEVVMQWPPGQVPRRGAAAAETATLSSVVSAPIRWPAAESGQSHWTAT